MRSWILAAALPWLYSSALMAQGNYEVQVYASELVPQGITMMEMHSNFTAKGSRFEEDGVLPTQHQEHQTLEVTHGFSEWFETGFYLFSSIQSHHGWNFVGSHIRPRIAVPSRYHLPVGLSLSTEFGYQRAIYSRDTWTWEIRPIVDKQMGRFYWSVNPTFEKSFHGPEQKHGYVFEPNVKLSYGITKMVAGGVEYYGAVGPLQNLIPLHDQEHAILPAVDVDFGPRWEFNFGVGIGVTHNTDH
ncbi:MAG TPA: hypothetical protein VG672_15935, partial [Bryobacteraceae bacterium]|nr:hypothetical protein [Bryobacteraceae bacterium]